LKKGKAGGYAGYIGKLDEGLGLYGMGWDGMRLMSGWWGCTTFIMLILLRSTRPISILMRSFLLLGGEGAGEGAEEVEV